MITKRVWGMVLAFSLVMATMSCSLFRPLFEDKVVTTIDNVQEAHQKDVVAAPIDYLPQDVQDRLKASGKNLVLVDKEWVIDMGAAVDVDEKPTSDTWMTIADTGLSIANAIWPGIAVLEGLGVLLSRRKRQHYATAVKAITPYDGDIAVKEAVLALAKGMGLAHSSEESKKAFEQPPQAA